MFLTKNFAKAKKAIGEAAHNTKQFASDLNESASSLSEETGKGKISSALTVIKALYQLSKGM